MTTTPEYIRKCEMAEEIQAMRAPKDGERYYDAKLGDFFAVNGEINVFGLIDNPKKPNRCLCYASVEGENVRVDYVLADHGDFECVAKIIWLPRLDQLCEILCDDEKTTGFSGWVINSVNFKHAEEMYLEDVMQTKFGKKWDGEKWI